MSDASAVEAAARRLIQAIDSLESSIERRLELDRGREGIAAQLHASDNDRSRLAAELDNLTARTRALEAANRAAAQRIDVAAEAIRAVLDRTE